MWRIEARDADRLRRTPVRRREEVAYWRSPPGEKAEEELRESRRATPTD
jgi:hypothetical protein